MNVLYLHPAAAFGGASKSLIELFQVLKTRDISGYVITPRGSAAKAFRASGMHTIETLGLSQFDNTRFGFYRKWRWLILLREFFFLPFSILALLRARHMNVKFDLIHVNEITLLPVALIAKYLFKLPLVMHIRSLQRHSKDNVSEFYFHIVRKVADKLICIDETVKKSLPEEIESVVIHNGLNINNTLLEQPKHENNSVKIAIVGVLLRLKGIYEFVEAAKIINDTSEIKVKFIIVGENARSPTRFLSWIYKKFQFSEDVYSDVKKYIEINKLEDVVELRGQIADITTFYPEIDILCFPSHLNACGRPVFEAAFFKIPSVVAVSNPTSDTIKHGVTGLTIDIPDSNMLADAILKLAKNREYRQKLGAQAYEFVKMNFDINNIAKEVINNYQSLIAK